MPWIAAGGGLFPRPLERRALPLSPGERADIVVDFSDGSPAALMTLADDNAPAMGLMGAAMGASPAGTVITVEVDSRPGQSAPLPARLAPDDAWDASQATRLRRFTLDMGMMGGMGMGGGMGMRGGMREGMDMFSINGRAFDSKRVDARVRLGDDEVWEVSAATMAHPFHIHGVHFRVISRNGGAPTGDDAGLRDTVRVDGTVRLHVRFAQPALSSPFMYHCHILEHEDHGMMGQFSVS